jgi:hypothetical protein
LFPEITWPLHAPPFLDVPSVFFWPLSRIFFCFSRLRLFLPFPFFSGSKKKTIFAL